MTGRLAEMLFVVTDVLLLPILVALVAMTAGSLWMLGGLTREAWERRRARPAWSAFLADLKAGRGDVASFPRVAMSGYAARFRNWLKGAERPKAGARKCLDDLEIDMARRLSWLSFATRVGPMLGLIGTLLPLGPALRGLASDELASLAENLEIAFTSTVFGLLVGGLAYAAGIIRRNWYDQDISDLEFALEAMETKEETRAAGLDSESVHA